MLLEQESQYRYTVLSSASAYSGLARIGDAETIISREALQELLSLSNILPPTLACFLTSSKLNRFCARVLQIAEQSVLLVYTHALVYALAHNKTQYNARRSIINETYLPILIRSSYELRILRKKKGGAIARLFKGTGVQRNISELTKTNKDEWFKGAERYTKIDSILYLLI